VTIKKVKIPLFPEGPMIPRNNLKALLKCSKTVKLKLRKMERFKIFARRSNYKSKKMTL
jgi:hypothetical protein